MSITADETETDISEAVKGCRATLKGLFRRHSEATVYIKPRHVPSHDDRNAHTSESSRANRLTLLRASSSCIYLMDQAGIAQILVVLSRTHRRQAQSLATSHKFENVQSSPDDLIFGRWTCCVN